MVLVNNSMAAGEGKKDATEQAEGEEKEVRRKVVGSEELGRRSSRVMIHVYTGEYICKMTN